MTDVTGSEIPSNASTAGKTNGKYGAIERLAVISNGYFSLLQDSPGWQIMVG
jgi:hypothetical protein